MQQMKIDKSAKNAEQRDNLRLEFQNDSLTLGGASDVGLEVVLVSYARISRRPSAVAKTFMLLSFAETASNQPSLLKRIRGVALKSEK